MAGLRVGVIGIGLMGAPMARNLLKAGFPVTVWNRTPEKAAALAAEGAAVAASAADCAAASDVLITMLENGAVVGEVLFAGGVAAAMAPGGVVVDMSSIGPSEAREHAAGLALRGVAHVDAPVSGGTVGAEAGTLSIMAGGDPEVFERVRPVLEAMGRPVLVGPSGAGQIAKLANQMIVGTTIGVVAEALVFAERAGADPAKVRAAIGGGFAGSRILEVHGARMIAHDFTTHGKTSSQIKDLENAERAGRAASAPLPYTHLSLGLFRETLGQAGDVDHSGLWLTLAGRPKE
jgi:2-hydroxy-3-oxopropionate reductase